MEPAKPHPTTLSQHLPQSLFARTAELLGMSFLRMG